MPKQEGQKRKLLALLQILERQTDEQHRLSSPQLIELLEQQGVRCDRKSLYSDIDALNRLGYDISLQRGPGGGYCMASRPFELAELKLLVDAVQSSRFIPQRKSDALIQKLTGLTSVYQAGQLQRQVYVSGRPKSLNERILYSVDALHDAISQARLVRFAYASRGGPKLHTVSPWQLAWENGAYYLIAYQDYAVPANIRNYRVDRMSEVKVLDEPRRGKEQFAAFDLPAYLKKHFNMYGGPEHQVTLRCTNDLKAAMQDRFGREPVFVPEEDGQHFHFTVPVCVSEQFYGWVFGFGGKVAVLAPQEVRAALGALAQKIAQQCAEVPKESEVPAEP